MSATPVPPYLTAITVDPAGLVPDASLPAPLPHGLQSRDFLRTVEDIQDLILDLNSLLATKAYNRLELLLDPAGFSGLISRTVADRLARASRGLVVNRHHNGYPDLIPAGKFLNDAVPSSDEGLEIKASRYENSWQSHGPREGWFAVVQFDLDAREAIPPANRDPTKVVAVMAAQLTKADWSWQPAKSGAIRSGTASVLPSGMARLRRGAIWIRPDYRARHDHLLASARLSVAAATLADKVREVIYAASGPITKDELVAVLAKDLDVPAARIAGRTSSRLTLLVRSGVVMRVSGRPLRYGR